MMENAKLSADGKTLSVHIPMTFRKRGGRKVVIVPEGTDVFMPTRPQPDAVLIKAITRGHSWRRRIEAGMCKSVTDLAAQEKVTDSYVGKILTLTMLAPDITEAILVGRQPRGLKLAQLLRNMPLAWDEQRRSFGFAPQET